MMQKVGHEGHRFSSKTPTCTTGFGSLIIQFVRVYLLSISLNGLHGKLTEQKTLHRILSCLKQESITSIRLFSASSIAMRKIKCFLSVDSILSIRIYDVFNTGHAKII